MQGGCYLGAWSSEMTPREFWDVCEAFDWYQAAGNAAVVAQRALFAEAPPGSENRTILDGFAAHKFSGKLHGTPQQPKPKQPE